MAPRPIVLHSAFAFAFLIVAIGAAATAYGTSGPWYAPDISSSVYATSLVASILLAAALAVVGTLTVGRVDDALRALELRIAALPEAADLPSAREITPADLQRIPPSDEEVDELLHVLHNAPSGGVPVAELEVTGTLVDVSTAITATRARRELLRAAIRQRSALLAERERVAPCVSAPILMSFLFTLIAGAMLPGSGGFAVRNFALNTGAVLFLSYGWLFLAMWAVAALVGLAGRDAPAP